MRGRLVAGRRGMLLIVAGALSVAACARILGLRDDELRMFPHRRHVLAGVSCTKCHVGITAAGDEGPLHLPTAATCTTSGCHAKPHNSAPCLACHSHPDAAANAARARTNITFSHVAHLGAANGNCARCHLGVADSDGPLRPPMVACWNCHEHDRVRDVRNCSACHPHLEAEHTPPADHIVHDLGFATSHGKYAAAAADACASCHRDSFCANCHGVTAPVIPARLALANPFAASVHRPAFLARHGEEARGEPAACTSCHLPQACSNCHNRAEVAGRASSGRPARSPHPKGWVGIGVGNNEHGLAARRDPLTCASCHGGAGEMLCVSCHAVGGSGGNPHPVGWSSASPLSALPCRLCHQPGWR